MDMLGRYMCLGMRDGSVLFVKAATGELLMVAQIFERNDKVSLFFFLFVDIDGPHGLLQVTAIHFVSDSMVVVGSGKGIVRR